MEILKTGKAAERRRTTHIHTYGNILSLMFSINVIAPDTRSSGRWGFEAWHHPHLAEQAGKEHG